MRATFEGPTSESTAQSRHDPSSLPQPLRATDTERPAIPLSKARNGGKTKGKGKGKATQWDSDDDDDDDDAYITSNDYGSPTMNGAAGFGNVGGDDDEELYG